MACRVTATAKSGNYTIETTYITDPSRNTRADAGRRSGRSSAGPTELYVRFDPTVNGNGGGGSGNGGADSATVDTSTGHPVLVASDTNTATNAANRDYAQPVFAALDGPFTRGVERLRRHGERRARRSSTQRTRSPPYTDAIDGNVVQTRARRASPATARPCSRSASARRGRGRRRGRGLARRPASTRRSATTEEAGRRTTTTLNKPRTTSSPGLGDQTRAAARGRVLPERERAQGVRGQDVPGRDRGEPRLAVGPGGLGRRSGEHVLRLVPRGVRARPLRGVDRPRRRRRPRDRARRDAVPLRAAAAARRLDAAQQPRQRQARARLVRHAARRGRLPDPDGRPARAHGRVALREPRQAGRELRRRARARRSASSAGRSRAATRRRRSPPRSPASSPRRTSRA